MQTKATKAYLYGALAGALAIASVLVTTYFLGKASYLGTSTTFVRAAGFIEEWFSPGVTSSLSYYIKEKVVMDWQFMLVIGIGLGAFISSMLNKEFSLETDINFSAIFPQFPAIFPAIFQKASDINPPPCSMDVE